MSHIPRAYVCPLDGNGQVFSSVVCGCGKNVEEDYGKVCVLKVVVQGTKEACEM